jgi:hypothetical protein
MFMLLLLFFRLSYVKGFDFPNLIRINNNYSAIRKMAFKDISIDVAR